MVDRVMEFKPDLVITEKGISGESSGSVSAKSSCGTMLIFERLDYAQYFLAKAGISAIRRVRKSDNNRIARAVGATIVNRVEDLRETDIGTKCGLFNIEKIGDE